MKKPVLIVLIVVILILFSAFGFLGYILYTKDMLTEDTSNTQELEKSKPIGETYRADINNIVLNITTSRGRIKLMKLSLTLKSIDPNIETVVEDYEAEFLDRVIRLVSSRSSEELLSLGGKSLLKEELLQNFNEVIEKVSEQNDEIVDNSIKKVLYTTFVMK